MNWSKKKIIVFNIVSSKKIFTMEACVKVQLKYWCKIFWHIDCLNSGFYYLLLIGTALQLYFRSYYDYTFCEQNVSDTLIQSSYVFHKKHTLNLINQKLFEATIEYSTLIFLAAFTKFSWTRATVVFVYEKLTNMRHLR